jgi:phosphatidylglycerophosphatase A
MNTPPTRKAADAVILWAAQGFGIGRIPVAPGTWGSLLGAGWLLVLLAPGQLWIYAAGLILSTFFSVWVCGRAEKILGRTDPGSVVMDEIIAVPLCFAVWIGRYTSQTGHFPSPGALLESKQLPVFIGLVIAFRFFDIAKPWPVRQSQCLPGGWGITIDDLLAALYVNLCYLAGTLLFR